MSVEPYSSFEFVKPADYLESFDKAANLGAWDDAEKQAKINAKVRVQNGKIYDKVIDNAYKLAPTLAKLYEQKRDKEEQVGRNEAVAIATKLRALGGDHNSRIAWEKDDNIHRGETSWMENMADEAEAAGKSDFAESLRNLHGRREVWVKEALAINHANQYRFNLEEGLHGGYNIPNPNIDGETIGIDNWEDQAELQSLVADWEIDKEYTEIAGLSSEFLHKHYLPAIEKQRQAFFQQQAYSRTKSNKETRKADYYEQIKLAGSDSQPVGNLVEKLIDVANNTSALYGGPVQSKVAAINSLDQMLADGEISREKYLQAMDVMIPNKGKQGKLERFGDVWKQHFGNWEDRIAKAEQKAFEAREVQHENRRKSFTSDIQEAIQEAGGDWTEDDVKFWSKSWSENPANVGIKPPEILNTLANDTVEDRADDDYVATMQANLDMGNPVGDGWRRIKDANLKKEWAQIASSAAGSGLSSDQKSFRDAQIGRWATAKLGETYGVEGQTGQWGKIQARGKVIYDKHFRKAYVLFPDDPGQRHQWALDETEKEIASTSIEALTKRPEIDINAPGIKLKNALNSIKTNKDNKINIITSGIIEGTEKDFEQVLKFAKNPVAYSIPSIYYQIAQKIRFKKKEDGKILTGWDIANYQHIAQTGQELPKPGWRKTMDTYSPAVQYFLQVAPSYKRKEQARILHQENGDFSKPEYTLPGVTATALQELGNK